MNQEAILPPLLADCGGSRRSTGSCCTNGCLLNSLSATRTQKMLPELSAPGGRKFFAFVERFFLRRVVVGFCAADRPLLLSSAGSLFLLLGSRPHLALPLFSLPLFSISSPALASNGLNRLASCQSRGLLWLRHKSARKNRNHLFRPGPERG